MITCEEELLVATAKATNNYRVVFEYSINIGYLQYEQHDETKYFNNLADAEAYGEECAKRKGIHILKLRREQLHSTLIGEEWM